MTLDEFKYALENIEDTLLNMELCEKVIEYYSGLTEQQAKDYKKSVRFIDIYYNSYKKIEDNKNNDINNSEVNINLLQKIDESVGDLTDKEKIAFKIYYELAKKFSYSINVCQRRFMIK